MAQQSLPQPGRFSQRWLWMMLAFLVVGLTGAAPPLFAASATHWTPFSFMTDDSFDWVERTLLLMNVVIAIAGLLYARMLVGEVYRADTGTPRMQEITRAVREGA